MADTNVRNYTTKQLLDRVKSLKSFKEIPKGYWVLCVRSTEDLSDSFDDKLYLMNGEINVFVSACTTNSGKYGLLEFKKWNSKGCFIVKSDEWFYDMWTGGMHKGKVKALVQVGKVLGYRDGNKDLKCDESGPIYEGVFGINLHAPSYNETPSFVKTYVAKLIGAWSVGCIVPASLNQVHNILARTYTQKRTTFCLLKEF